MLSPCPAQPCPQEGGLSLCLCPQHWLTQSARLISQAGSAVEWVTPLGIPIIQPYHRESKLVVSEPLCTPLSLFPSQAFPRLIVPPCPQIRGGLQSVTWNSSVDSSQ